jgi:dipeptidyl aminopeptidase/acylaminoacyl peptidase
MITIIKLSARASCILLVFWSLGLGVVYAAAHSGPPLPPLLYTNRNQELWLWPIDTAPRRLLDRLDSFPVAQWSPDGETIAVHRDDGWELYPARCLLGGEICQPAPLDPELFDVRVAWGPDGATIAYLPGSKGDTVRIRSRGCWQGEADACFAQDIRITSFQHYLQLAWSPDGRWMAFFGLNQGLFLLDMNCLPDACLNKARPVSVDTRNMHYWPSFSPDGNRLLYYIAPNAQPEHVWMVDINSLQTKRLTFGSGDHFMPAWSRDGHYIAYIHHERRTNTWSIGLLDTTRDIHVRGLVVPYQQLFSAVEWGPPGFVP